MPETQLDIILRAYDRMSAPINAAVNKAQAKLSSLAQRTDYLANKAYHSGKEFTASGLAVAAPLVAVTKLAMDFEDTMADIAKVANMDRTSGEFKKMSAEVLSTSEYLATSGDNVGKLYSSLLAGGTAKAELSKVARIAGEASVAFDMTQEAAGEAFITMKNALGISVDETKKAFDATNALTNKFGGKAAQILNFMSNGGASVARTLKVSAPAMEAFGRALMMQGVAAGEAGTVMERFRAQLYKNKEALALFNRAGGGEKGMVAVFETAKKSGDPFKWFQAHKFGAYSSQMSLLAMNTGKLHEMLTYVGDEQNYLNSAQQEFANRTSTTSFKLEQAKIAFQNAATKAGTVLLPSLIKLVKAVTPLIEKFSKWVENNPKLVERIAKTAAVFTALALAGGYLSFAMGGVFRLFNYAAVGSRGLSKAIGFLTDKEKGLTHWIFVARYRMLEFSQFLTNKALPALIKFGKNFPSNLVEGFKSVGKAAMAAGRALLANPIILIITAIAVAAFLIIKYWTPIKAFFIGIWDKIKDYVLPVLDMLKKAFLYFTPIGWIIQLWQPMVGLVKAIFGFIQTIVMVFFGIWKWLFLHLTPAGWIIKHWGVIVRIAKGIFKKLIDIVIGVGVDLYNWFIDPWVKIGKAIFDSGYNIMKSLVDGIKRGIHLVTDIINDVTQSIRDFFPFFPAKRGALRTIHQVKLMKTIADNTKPDELIGAVGRTTKQVVSFMNKGAGAPPLKGIGRSADGGMVANFNINLNGGATKGDATLVAAECKKQFQQWIMQYGNQQARASFA